MYIHSYIHIYTHPYKYGPQGNVTTNESTPVVADHNTIDNACYQEMAYTQAHRFHFRLGMPYFAWTFRKTLHAEKFLLRETRYPMCTKPNSRYPTKESLF